MTLPYFTWPLGLSHDPDPADVTYLASVRADGMTWTAKSDPDYPDVIVPDGPGKLVDPLTIKRSLPTSDLWPLQPDPAEATFAVVTENASDLDLALGDPVVIKINTPPNPFATPVEAFYGRVADVKVTVGDYGVRLDDGTAATWSALHTITAVDYLADNSEAQVRWGQPYLGMIGDTALTGDLIGSIFDQLGMGDVVFEDYDGLDVAFHSPWVLVPEKNTELGGLEHLENLLRQWALTGDDRGPARYVLDQNIDPLTGEPDTDQPYVFRLAFKRMSPLANDYLDEPDPAHMAVLDGGLVERATSYTLRKYDGIRRVIAYPAPGFGLDRKVSSLSGTPKPTIKLATSIGQGPSESFAFTQGRVDDLADFYLPASVPRNRWAADGFRWRMHRAPEGSAMPQLGAVLAVSPLAPEYVPTGNTWFTGRLTDYQLTIAGGRPVVDFNLRDVAS